MIRFVEDWENPHSYAVFADSMIIVVPKRLGRRREMVKGNESEAMRQSV